MNRATFLAEMTIKVEARLRSSSIILNRQQERELEQQDNADEIEYGGSGRGVPTEGSEIVEGDSESADSRSYRIPGVPLLLQGRER